MIRFFIQYIVGARPSGVDEEDLGWSDIQGESFEVEDQAWAAADGYDRDFDHRFTHRVVAREVEAAVRAPSAPPAPLAPIAKATAPVRPRRTALAIEGTPLPKKEPSVNRQLKEYRAQNRVAENLEKLRGAIEPGAALPVAFLQLLVELIESDLGECGKTVLAASLRKQFEALQKRAGGTHQTLRVVK